MRPVAGLVAHAGRASRNPSRDASHAASGERPRERVKADSDFVDGLVVVGELRRVALGRQAEAIAGEKLLAGGVAMKLDVGAGLNIAGQVSQASNNVKIDPKTKKRLVFIPPRVGSNLPGKWVPEDSAEAVAARNSGELRTEDLRKWQDHGNATALGR